MAKGLRYVPVGEDSVREFRNFRRWDKDTKKATVEEQVLLYRRSDVVEEAYAEPIATHYEGGKAVGILIYDASLTEIKKEEEGN